MDPVWEKRREKARGGERRGTVGGGGRNGGRGGVLEGARRTWGGPELQQCNSGPPRTEDGRGMDRREMMECEGRG
jgi:hypothetical protein